MMTFEEALIHFRIDHGELTAWIEQSWVRPLREGERVYFDDVDVSRLQLICELKDVLAVNEEAVPVVLGLLDKLYAARVTLHHVGEALHDLPEPLRETVWQHLRARGIHDPTAE